MNLKEYKERLLKHDWLYFMSDDSRRYNTAYEEQQQLEKLKEGKKTYEDAYRRRVAKMFPKKTSK